jgi:hypothetical protein
MSWHRLTIEEACRSIGSIVIHGSESAVMKYGVITSVGECLVFVRYRDDQHSSATRPADLMKP